ncbi:hypothetical protein GY45DRAFT_1329844 [Cubamyces sp. BRFM 1775]|nr:hypothetical protein GY45DRAFT_1329844 [Cubamyces sp. BRFM 1775]
MLVQLRTFILAIALASLSVSFVAAAPTPGTEIDCGDPGSDVGRREDHIENCWL